MINQVRLLEERDIEATNILHHQIFNQFLDFNEYTTGENYYYGFIIEQDNEIAGYLIGQIIFEMADLFYVAVSPKFLKRGFGDLLVKAFIDKVAELNGENISLEVRVSNQAAIGLYEKYGFRNVGTRRHYYDDGEDALMMMYNLK